MAEGLRPGTPQLRLACPVPACPPHPGCTLLLQVVAGFIRPSPGGAHKHLRSIWNAAHHNLGRLVLLGAWATIWLGVAWANKIKALTGGLARWAAPLAGKEAGLQGRSLTGCKVLCRSAVERQLGLE